ncbi:MAG: hypothetical protein AAF825_02520 [Pseudomonadota bacterium]
MFGTQKNREFEKTLRKALPNGFELPEELWRFIQWLEAKKQTFRYRRTNRLFLPTMPVESIDHTWSHIAFVIEPDLVRHWFGRDGLEELLVPLVRCGGDGSHFAVWKNGENTEFVFLGSEGEAFTVTGGVQEFIVLITMGYVSLEDRRSLMSTPSENYAEVFDDEWPDPVEVKRHIQSAFGIIYPVTGENYVTPVEDDPFVKFVAATIANV